MAKQLKHMFVVIAGLITLLHGKRADGQNPQEHWQQYKSVEQAGFSTRELQTAKQYYDSLKSSAFMIVQNGKVVAAWGDINRRFTVLCRRMKKIMPNQWMNHSIERMYSIRRKK
jgi:hypothetical protein